MNCEAISKLLISFVDGRAESKERSQVENHLQECAACSARVQQYRAVWSLLDAKGTQTMMKSVLGVASQLADYRPPTATRVYAWPSRSRSGSVGWCLRRVWLFPPHC